MSESDFLAPPEWVDHFVRQMGGPFADVPSDLELLVEAERRVVELEAEVAWLREQLTIALGPSADTETGKRILGLK
jgi:hypothetical protein